MTTKFRERKGGENGRSKVIADNNAVYCLLESGELTPIPIKIK